MRTRGLDEVRRRLGDVAGFLRSRAAPAALEVGCGFGHAMRDLRAEVPGLGVVGMNREEYPEQVSGQDYVYGDAAVRLPLPDGSVDLVYSIVTLYFLADRARFLEEAFRVLRPGGEVRVNLYREVKAEVEAGDLRVPDVVEGPEGLTTLRDHLLALPDLDARVVPSEASEYLVLTRHTGDPPLRLGLRTVPERQVDYAVRYGERAEGFQG